MRVLIAGGGQAGAMIARRLIREGNEVTIVEENPERCATLDEELDAKVVRGSAASVKTLQKANISGAEMLIAITSSDSANMLACLVAEAEGNKGVKVARIRTHEFEHWRRVSQQVGPKIDLIIHPETNIQDRIMRVVRVPGVSDIVDFADGRIKLFGMNVSNESWFCGKTLEELDRAGPPENSLVAMIFRGQQVIIPHGAQVLEAGDHIYICCTSENLEHVLAFMGVPKQESLDRVFILGGKQLGIGVALDLEKQGVSVKLFERDGSRCARMAEILKNTIVVNADGTDQATLEEANIAGVGAFLALTNHDEDNIIASLLARRLGAKKVVALINRLSYLPMVQRLGINTSVSQRTATVDGVLQFVRKGRVLSVTTFREEEAEAIELIASPDSKYVGKKLRDVRLPRGAIVGAIYRKDGAAVVPRGAATIEAGDRVIFFTLESAVPELESAFLAESRSKVLQ